MDNEQFLDYDRAYECIVCGELSAPYEDMDIPRHLMCGYCESQDTEDAPYFHLTSEVD